MPAKAVRLPLTIDPEALAREVALIGAEEWVAHFNAGYHDGGWSGVALRVPRGASTGHALYPAPGREYADAALLDRCPQLRRALAAFQCPLLSARLLKLEPGCVIREHRDDGIGFATGEVRLHAPITTNPEVAFYVDGDRVEMAAGEAWYLDLGLAHRVQNLGPTDRIHLVIDCRVNEWLVAQIAAGEAAAAAAGSPGEAALAAIREWVWSDARGQDLFWAIEDSDALVSAALEEAARRGWRLTSEDLRAAMRGTRRTLGRWRIE